MGLFLLLFPDLYPRLVVTPFALWLEPLKSTVLRYFSNATWFSYMFKNCFFYIYISAVSGSLRFGCSTCCYFWLCLWGCWPTGWHLLICLGLGTNAQKHTMDGTRSLLLPLGWCFLVEIVQYGSMYVHVARPDFTLAWQHIV